MPRVREEWLALTIEEPVDPGAPICDAHHHLLSEGYSIDDFLRDIAGGHNIESTVHVESDDTHYRTSGPEALRPVGETEYVLAQAESRGAAKTEVAAAVVGFADLTLGSSVDQVLEAHIEASRGRFRGVRQSKTWHDSPDLISWATEPKPLSNRRFREGLQFLEGHGLSFDAWVFHTQLEEVADLAAALPELTIILNHIGGPLGVGPYAGRREEVHEEWKRGIAGLAPFPNVVVKLGGLGMPMCGFPWRKAPVPPSSTELAEGMAPYYLWCIDQLTADRCMFESNFPADKVSSSYTVLWNAFKHMIAGLSDEARTSLLHGTAARVYRL